MAILPGNHVNIVPAPVKDIFEKCPDEIPSGTAMEPHGAYYTVINIK